MPFLSRIWINPLRQGAQKLLQHPQAMHAAVLGGIPTQPVQERVLWRIDTDCPRRPALFVVSASRPSWEHLVEQAGWSGADTPQAEVRDYEPLLQRVEADRRFAFRLAANPAQATKNPDKLTGSQKAARERDPRRPVIVGHRTVAHQIDWLLSRVASWGVRIPAARTDETADDDADTGAPPPDVRVAARQRLSFPRQGGQRVTIQQVLYEGHLIVEDPLRLRDVLTSGVGRAKAYGCGLMTLAPSTSPG